MRIGATPDDRSAVASRAAALLQRNSDHHRACGELGIKPDLKPMTETREPDTLLAHLAEKLSHRHEDIAVEALGYIFQSRAARRVVKEVLRDGGAEVGPIEQVRTQVSEGQTRPDLVGFDRHDKECVFIEAKFWAGLTEQQPIAYLKRLPPHTALVVVAPASRIERLWAELRRRAGADGPRPASEPAAVRSVMSVCGRHLMLTSWAHLLARLDGATDAHTTIAVQQLRGLIKMKTENVFHFHPLHLDELDRKVPRRLLSLQRLVDDATTRAVEHEYASTAGSVRPTTTSYGRYLSLADAAAWFGIDFMCWAWDSYPDTPLWLSFQEEWRSEESRSLGEIRRALEPLKQKAPSDVSRRMERCMSLLIYRHTPSMTRCSRRWADVSRRSRI